MKRLKSYLDDDEWRAKRVRINGGADYLSYQTKTAKACINIQPSKVYIFNHNTREEQPEYEAKYVVKELEKFNEYSCDANEANAKFKELYDEATTNYFNRTHQRIQTKNLRFSAVVTINENHTLQDVQNLALKIEQIYGLQPIQTAIHRDEGHFKVGENGEKLKDENGNFIFDPNLHAHIEFFALDEQGINRYKAKDRYRINKELQTLAANELKMERGKDYAALGQKVPKHLSRQEYAVFKATQERHTARLNELSQANKELRELLKQNGASRAEYAKLEQENKEFKERLKNNELVSKDEIAKWKEAWQEAKNDFAGQLKLIQNERNQRQEIITQYREEQVKLIEYPENHIDRIFKQNTHSKSFGRVEYDIVSIQSEVKKLVKEQKLLAEKMLNERIKFSQTQSERLFNYEMKEFELGLSASVQKLNQQQNQYIEKSKKKEFER